MRPRPVHRRVEAFPQPGVADRRDPRPAGHRPGGREVPFQHRHLLRHRARQVRPVARSGPGEAAHGAGELMGCGLQLQRKPERKVRPAWTGPPPYGRDLAESPRHASQVKSHPLEVTASASPLNRAFGHRLSSRTVVLLHGPGPCPRSQEPETRPVADRVGGIGLPDRGADDHFPAGGSFELGSGGLYPAGRPGRAVLQDNDVEVGVPVEVDVGRQAGGLLNLTGAEIAPCPLTYFQLVALTPLPAGPLKLSDHTVLHGAAGAVASVRGSGLEVACGLGPPDVQPSRLAVSTTAPTAMSRGVIPRPVTGVSCHGVRQRVSFISVPPQSGCFAAPCPADHQAHRKASVACAAGRARHTLLPKMLRCMAGSAVSCR